ncbi:uncharacterized protein LOC122393006 [Amphibalanus amphitrite]|uniref:uncharacterized protein LOC122393006 n=1 Tax=Amphibalanus amphitrite TaxID=1232801 RepID=UPI001C90CE61|nr:uncharacterized protein LOC122393006 [Amphibalanus amphitrite]
MPHYLSPLSSVTTVTTCRLQGRSPRRPRQRPVSGPCPCGCQCVQEADGSLMSQADPLELPAVAEVKTEPGANSVEEFNDAVECSEKDDASEDSSAESEELKSSQIKSEPNEEPLETSDDLQDSPMKADFSSDESPAKSAISGDSFDLPVKDEAAGGSDEELDVHDTAETSKGSSDAASGPSASISPKRLRAAAQVIGQCGQGSPRRRTTQQPRDFSRERPAGTRYIRLAVNTVKRRRPRKSASPKRQRTHSPEVSECIMRTTFYP